MTGAPRDHFRALYGASVSPTAGNFCCTGRPHRDQHILSDFEKAVEVTGMSHSVALRQFRYCGVSDSSRFVLQMLWLLALKILLLAC